jgi:hypothetical protein
MSMPGAFQPSLRDWFDFAITIQGLKAKVRGIHILRTRYSHSMVPGGLDVMS